MKTTEYFDVIRRRRTARIRDSWITRVIVRPEYERKQADGQSCDGPRIEEAGGRWLRVVVLADGATVHNAFFDRGFEP